MSTREREAANAERGTGNGDRETVRIERLATGGDGVGRLSDGQTVFVPRTAPGDLVELGRIRRYARFSRARLARVVEPGPGRATPPCNHYVGDDCGGCQLQHLNPELQLESKRRFVADALERIGGLNLEVPPVIPSPAQWEYRARISLALAPGRRHAGFHPVDQPTRVFPLERCLISAAPLMELWRAVRTQLHLLPADIQQLVLRLDHEGNGHMVVKSGGQTAWTAGARLGERLPAGATVWWHPEGGSPRVVSGDREAFPATVFEQVNPALGHDIREYALQQLGSVAGLHTWDLYAGIGETTDQLRYLGATVESVELDRRAVELAERRSRITGHLPDDSQRPDDLGVVRHSGRAEDLVGRMKDPALVITNPPRTGMERVVIDELVRRRPPRLVYVSCDPATLARDLGLLCGTSRAGSSGSGGFQVTVVQPFDLFPQTAHVETVVTLEAR